MVLQLNASATTLPQINLMEIGSLADWFSALGTISACAIALGTSWREGQPRIVSQSATFLTDQKGRKRKLLVSIRNASYLPVHVTHVSIRVGLFRAQMLDIGYFIDKPMEALSYGDEAEFSFVLSNLYERANEVWSKRKLRVLERMFRRAFRIRVFLADGRKHDSTLSDDARRFILGKATFEPIEHLPHEESRPRVRRALRPPSSGLEPF